MKRHPSALGFVLLSALSLHAQATGAPGSTIADQAKWEVTRARLDTFAAAEETYRAANGGYVQARGAADILAALHLDSAIDAWGTNLQLFSGASWFMARSAGPDKAAGTGDDLIARDRTHADLNAIALVAEQYRSDKGTYPESLSAATPPSNDLWGTPYRYRATGGLAGFVVVSAGADREFGTHDDVQLADSTTADLRSVAIALNAYAQDHQVYPAAASFEQMVGAIQPVYIMQTPRTDVWGTEFRYEPTADAKAYVLASAGPDRLFGTKDDVKAPQ